MTRAESPRVLRMLPDYAADPLWGQQGEVNLDSLPITDQLRADLRSWAREWEALVGGPEGHAIEDSEAYLRWRRSGRRLSRAAQAELGDAVVVRYEA